MELKFFWDIRSYLLAIIYLFFITTNFCSWNTLYMETARSFEMLVTTCQLTRRRFPECPKRNNIKFGSFFLSDLPNNFTELFSSHF